jgi:Domain of unknown function (DUF4276)
MGDSFMHFEILVEDQSGKKALEILIPKILGNRPTFAIYSYKGIGRIPRNMRDADDPSKRILLENIPKLLKVYGKAFAGYPPNYKAAVIVVCDLDDKNLSAFIEELAAILDACHPKPTTRFCLAIEEGEAWLLGDLPAVRTAYANADNAVLNSYVNDSICGTWEKLADAIFPGGARKLSARGWQSIGAEKSKWATEISPHMDIDTNLSPSFEFFREALRSLAT